MVFDQAIKNGTEKYTKIAPNNIWKSQKSLIQHCERSELRAYGQIVLPDRSLLIGQKLVENAKIEKFKCDILRGQKFIKNAKNV